MWTPPLPHSIITATARQTDQARHVESADDSSNLETDPLATEDGHKFRKSLRLTSAQIEELNLINLYRTLMEIELTQHVLLFQFYKLKD